MMEAVGRGAMGDDVVDVVVVVRRWKKLGRVMLEKAREREVFSDCWMIFEDSIFDFSPKEKRGGGV